MHLNIFIVDDELQTRTTLKALLQEFCPGTTVTGMAGDIHEALSQLGTLQVDVLFLDINLGDGSTGFDLLDQLGSYNYDVVFVTAYESHAMKAFDYEAVHYLLKPVNRIVLRDTIARIRKRRTANQTTNVQQLAEILQANQQNAAPRIALSDTGKTEFVPISDIIYMESNGSYTVFYLADKRHFIRSKNLKYFEDTLMQYPQFMRVHKSYIVNRDQIRAYRKNSQELEFFNGSVIPISLGYRTFIEQLGSKFIL
jgi:two-component system LytT family response regulator